MDMVVLGVDGWKHHQRNVKNTHTHALFLVFKAGDGKGRWGG